MKQRVLLKGKPGLELLHRISSADILGLSSGQKRQGLILNPRGRILSHFEVLRTNEDSIEIEFEDEFLSHLEHFTFSERYQLEPLPPRQELPVPEIERIRSLTAKAGHEFKSDGETNPLEVNLRSAIADQKGCYPGQEVIEKILSLGSPARKLCLIRRLTGSNDPGAPATALGEDGSEAGLLTSVSEGWALAILKRTHCKTGQRILISNQEWLVEKVAE